MSLWTFRCCWHHWQLNILMNLVVEWNTSHFMQCITYIQCLYLAVSTNINVGMLHACCVGCNYVQPSRSTLEAVLSMPLPWFYGSRSVVACTVTIQLRCFRLAYIIMTGFVPVTPNSVLANVKRFNIIFNITKLGWCNTVAQEPAECFFFICFVFRNMQYLGKYPLID